MSQLPGSCGYPIFGDKSVEFYRDPELFITTKISETSSKVFLTRLVNTPTIFVCSHQETTEILYEKSRDFDHGYREFLYNSYGDNLLFENGEAAKLLRNCLTPIFTNITQYESSIEEFFGKFFENFPPNGELVNVYEEFKSLMTKFCLKFFLGFSDTSSERSKSISELATLHWHGIISLPVSVKIPFAGQSGWSKAIEAKEKLLIHIRKMIAAEKNNSSSKLDASVSKNDAYVNPNKSNVIQQMLQAPFMNRDKNMEQHILLFISSLIPKAFSSIITSFILEMAAKERANLRESAALDSQLLSRILLEVQRLWPPFLGGRRIANKDTTIGGYKIPKGYAVIYVSYFAHRDKNVFKNPDEFNPDRWLNQGNTISANSIFTFGGGERVCIGHRLIQYILQRLTKTLLEKFTWEIDGDVNNTKKYKLLPVARPTELPCVRFHNKI
ncbi:cytochrome P450 26B1-like [Styela clava]